MQPDSLTKGISSHNMRSSNVRNTVNTVSNRDRSCGVCGGTVKAGAKKYCSHACYVIDHTTPVPERFWPKVDRRGATDCWLWTGYVFGSLGYGGLHLGGRPLYAHRIAWELANGAIPDGQWVLHSCDVPRCVNPAHLFLGTHTTNMQDAARKGRLSVPRPKAQAVTDAQIAEMHVLRAQGATLQVIADRFSVTKTYVSLVLRGLRRQHVKGAA